MREIGKPGKPAVQRGIGLLTLLLSLMVVAASLLHVLANGYLGEGLVAALKGPGAPSLMALIAGLALATAGGLLVGEAGRAGGDAAPQAGVTEEGVEDGMTER